MQVKQRKVKKGGSMDLFNPLFINVFSHNKILIADFFGKLVPFYRHYKFIRRGVIRD